MYFLYVIVIQSRGEGSSVQGIKISNLFGLARTTLYLMNCPQMTPVSRLRLFKRQSVIQRSSISQDYPRVSVRLFSASKHFFFHSNSKLTTSTPYFFFPFRTSKHSVLNILQSWLISDRRGRGTLSLLLVHIRVFDNYNLGAK